MRGPELARAEQPGRLAQRHTTVLFAELRGTAQAAAGAGGRYLEVLGQAAELSGGRVLHRRDNGVLALFATPNAAAAAAARMHTYAATLPPAPGKPALRIGFHAGPVGQRGQDIFGDTVNLALQVADEAKSGQVLISHDTASSLSPAIQGLVRPAHHIQVKGKDAEVLLGELVWRDAINSIVSAHASASAARAVLQVTYRGKTLTRRRQGDSVSMGRDPECDVLVDGAKVSRRHCTLLLRAAMPILRDDSSNGTFVAVQGRDEVHVRGGELPLGGSGSISLGQPATDDIVRYRYD